MIDIPLVDLTVHHAPRDMRDRIALGFTKILRFCAAKRYGHFANVLEAVAVVRGMFGATINRDANHGFADELGGKAPAIKAAPYPSMPITPDHG